MKTVICILVFSAQFAFAHGEDKYGPNKGFVRMPGAFHTEIVPVGKNKLKVFLLDIGWENPSISRSSVVLILSEKTDVQANCKTESNYFLCEFPNSVNLYKKGELKLTAQREDQKGQVAIYKLPLNLEKSTPMPDVDSEKKTDHSGHH